VKIHALILALASTLLLCSWPGIAGEQEHALPAELKAEVPALTALHDVIFDLWHNAWAARDVAHMKKMLPEVEQRAAAVTAAKLPGILRDKQAEWKAGVVALNQALDRYRKAAAAGTDQPLLDAVEALHMRFENLVRIIKPVMPELQDYHVVLYRIYHQDLPQKDFAKLAHNSEELERRCGALASAAVPKRFAAIGDRLAQEVSRLCAATASLRAAVAGGDGDAIATAVEAVHSQYQTVEGLFE
jgi:hypothetical protein